MPFHANEAVTVATGESPLSFPGLYRVIPSPPSFSSASVRVQRMWARQVIVYEPVGKPLDVPETALSSLGFQFGPSPDLSQTWHLVY
jgi:hypothetical protein